MEITPFEERKEIDQSKDVEMKVDEQKDGDNNVSLEEIQVEIGDEE